MDNQYCWRYENGKQYLDRLRTGMPPVILCCACNGGMQGKEYNENLPETAEEIAESVHEAYLAGASMVHVHARDPKYLPDPARSADIWFDVNNKIRQACPDIIINNTTGGGIGMTMEERLSSLAPKPEVASLNLCPDMSRFRFRARKPPLPHPRDEFEYDDCVPFTYKQIRWYAEEMKRRGIKPELEYYHPGCSWVVDYLIEEHLIDPPYWIQTVMGIQTSSLPTIDNLLQLLRDLPDDTIWLCSGIGTAQLPITTFAILLGGHVRVGLEDNIYYRRGEKAKSNRQLVERSVRLIRELNRDVATPQQAREILGLPTAAERTR